MSLPELRTARMNGVRDSVVAPSDLAYAETFRSSVSGAEFRRALSCLAAGTSILTTFDQEGQLLGMTATAVTSVSLDPPLVLACVDNRTRTAAALMSGAPFIVQFLAQHQESLARQFASRIDDKFAGVAYHLTASGCPMLEDVLASVECVSHQFVPSGDHTIVIGRVVDVRIADNYLSPLIYFRSQFL